MIVLLQETSTDDALKRASIVLDVVSWLCDGQNREMQEILRKQGFAFSVSETDNVLAMCCFIFK